MPDNQQYFTTVLNPPPAFTPAQRLLQARGKPFTDTVEGESYEAHQKREQAAKVLENVELLIWYSNARNESITQTTHYFRNMMLGLEEDEVIWQEAWEVPIGQRAKGRDDGNVSMGEKSPARSAKANDKAKDKERGKKKE